MNAFIYTRFSPRPNGAECESGKAQEERCIAYCEMRGLTRLCTFNDEEVSGRLPLGARPSGNKMLQRLSERQAQAVVVAKLDRVFRNTIDCLKTLQAWESCGIALHVADTGATIDCSTALGKLLLTIMVSFSEYEPALIAERTSQAMRRHQGNGKSMSSYAPFGYRKVGGKLTEHAGEQKALSRIAELHRQGMSSRGIAGTLADEGFKPRGKTWHHSTITRYLKRGPITCE